MTTPHDGGQFEKGIEWAEEQLASTFGYENAPTNVVLFAGFGWLDRQAALRALRQDAATLHLNLGGKRWATVWAALGTLLGGIITKVVS